ncbi:MAG: metallophosphatase family protein, partial [Anaerolineales bacterium]|nr:metallophosphatase family protein [Anaerolineales bacterium]
NPDYVIIAGDIVNRGPRPLECFQFVREKQLNYGWKLIRGNHEEYVLHNINPRTLYTCTAVGVHRASIWTGKQLGVEVETLKSLPIQESLIGPDGREVRFVHGSMKGLRDGIYPETSDAELCEKIELPNKQKNNYPPPSVFCVGHTHRPLIRTLDGTTVVNAGSVGLPFDGDTRLAYAQLTWQGDKWKTEIVRLEYDRELAERDFYASGYLEGGGPLVKLVQIELRTAHSQLYSWAAKYQKSILASEISVEASVNEYISSSFGESAI